MELRGCGHARRTGSTATSESQLWHAAATGSLVVQVEQRFPAQALETLRLLTAVAAPGIFDHFDKLPTLTCVVPATSLFTPSNDTTSTSQSIQISRNIAVPVRAQGKTLSPPAAHPQIVCWRMQGGWSGWALLSDLLSEYAGVPSSSTLAVVTAGDDVFGAAPPAPLWRDEKEREDIVVAAIDLFATALQHEDAEALAEHLDVEALFRYAGRTLTCSSSRLTCAQSTRTTAAQGPQHALSAAFATTRRHLDHPSCHTLLPSSSCRSVARRQSSRDVRCDSRPRQLRPFALH